MLGAGSCCGGFFQNPWTPFSIGVVGDYILGDTLEPTPLQLNRDSCPESNKVEPRLRFTDLRDKDVLDLT